MNIQPIITYYTFWNTFRPSIPKHIYNLANLVTSNKMSIQYYNLLDVRFKEYWTKV